LAFIGGIGTDRYSAAHSRRVLILADFAPRILSLPFAFIGGVLAAYAGGGVLSLGSLIEFITVFGIAARNGIMLISHYRHLEEKEGMVFGTAHVIRGAKERLSPILMTALSTGFALVPLVLSGNIPARNDRFMVIRSTVDKHRASDEEP
jgi:Cu/Ag efflux pump CusA